MRIAELSSRSGTSIPTIKYYLREGLLPAGTATGRNQADYGEEHIRRLRLIRALIDIGGLSVAAARDVLAAADSSELPNLEKLGAAQYALDQGTRRDVADPVWQEARAQIARLVRERGWDCGDGSPYLDRAADAIAALRTLGQDDLLVAIPAYFTAAEQVAAVEVDSVLRRGDPSRMVEGVVTGTILGEALLAAIRRLAHQQVSNQMLADLGVRRPS